MKLQLDESVPRRLALSFPESFVLHPVQGRGWARTAMSWRERLAPNLHILAVP